MNRKPSKDIIPVGANAPIKLDKVQFLKILLIQGNITRLRSL